MSLRKFKISSEKMLSKTPKQPANPLQIKSIQSAFIPITEIFIIKMFSDAFYSNSAI